jgi:hypothetical protein
MKVFKDYYASKPARAYKGVTYVNEYPPFDQAIHVKSVLVYHLITLAELHIRGLGQVTKMKGTNKNLNKSWR